MTENMLYVAQKNGNINNLVVFGILKQYDDLYSFQYTRGVNKINEFQPIMGMENFNILYESDTLFPIFQNRILSEKRPEFSNLTKLIGLNNKDDISSFDILSRTNGLRATDSLQLFKNVHWDNNGSFEYFFFIHGLAYLANSAIDRIQKLNKDDELMFCVDNQNNYDLNAVLLRTNKPAELIGYCPRYLAKTVKRILQYAEGNSDCKPKVTVELCNDNNAPFNYRLLCKMTGKIDSKLSEMVSKDDEYQPIINID